MASLELHKNLAYVFSDIKSWSIKNGLKLNESKTECLHFVSRYRTGSSVSSISLDDGPIQCATVARNLGVTFDNDLSLRTHVNNVCKSASFALHKIGSIRPFLTKATAHRLVQALVMSRLDFCNSLLFGLPDLQINKLQRIQNSAARLIVKCRKRESVSPILRELHMLKISERIDFKILLLTFKCLRNSAPVYLQELITKYAPSRNLRSASRSLLSVPTRKTESYGFRSFHSASPHLWNNLPQCIKDTDSTEKFKSMLKTYLFVK